ncbi:hypothetical protein QBC35DRAFT_396462 [Podospora australis]|uniref:Uncharacterized protein n=1 Tax=Podospora australis TaxID=1536484 RepID=A0AAN6WL85_9PEZI|nr:hypothetical protein QBC35DRAFT_396462 [Podospora australis]
MQTQLLSLQGALQDSTSELDRQLQQIRKLQREAEEREKAIQEIDQKLQASEEKRLEQDERLGRLRQKVSDAAASKSADAVPEQSHLRIPESEIIKLARELGYEVQNFVLNYLKDTSKSKMQTWAEIHAGRLKEITPYYNTYATDKKAMLRFVEAAIWAMLMRDVFMSSTTHGNVVWAGKYGKRLYRLSSSLAFTVQGDTTKERLFHQWKALTTGFLNKSTAQQLGRDDSIRDIVEGLEDLLEQLRPRHPISHGLQTIVEKAVALDEIFCGQHALYEFQYSEPRHDIYVDRKYMSVVEGSPQSNKVVRFSIRPYLSRAGGLRGESYSEFVCIENQLVWT